MTSGQPDFKGGGLMEGNFRDEDGVDRVAGPPDELKPLLLVLKEKANGEGIDLAGEFQDAGASCYGTMSKGQFNGQLVKTFKRFHFTDALLGQITSAYGTGLPDHKWGGLKEVAWMDFVEDISKAEGSASTTVGSASIGGAFGGKSRDEDGTIDRVPDPPEALKKFLIVFKKKNFSAGIDLLGALRGAGASPNGTMKKRQFFICLKQTYREFTFSEQLLFSFAAAYGCGDADAAEGGMTHVAWKDFCEDVEAQDPRDVTAEVAREIDGYCRAGSATLGD